MEIWKDIEGYEGRYQVSNLGNVKTLHYNGRYGERLLSKWNDRRGYLLVRLNDKNFLVHRLVANAFIPKEDGKEYVNHIDENKENNFVENLEWCDLQYNNKYGTREQRIVEKCAHPVMCLTTGTKYRSIRQAYIETGVSRHSIQKCCRGIWKTAGGLRWAWMQ